MQNFFWLLILSVFCVSAEPLFETTTLWGMYPNNHPNYRIPSIITAPNGDLLVFAEKRNHGILDIGDTDIVMKRSSDLGKTWSKEIIVYDPGYETCADITPVIDLEKGRIWIFFLRDKKRYYTMHSDDNMYTWCKPYEIHSSVVAPEWDDYNAGKNQIVFVPPGTSTRDKIQTWERNWFQRYGVGPGAAGIQKKQFPHKGRLIIPARHMENGGHRSHVFFSDDHGATWKLGGTVGEGNECQLVELPDGRLFISMRDPDNSRRPNRLSRRFAQSRDGGEAWESYTLAGEKIPTVQCHASIINYDNKLLLFSNPASRYREEKHPYGRYNMTVRFSQDGGNNWIGGHTIWEHPSSYSDMTVLPDGTIGLVYERGPQGSTHYWDELQFVRFNMEWLQNGIILLKDACKICHRVCCRCDGTR
ncbi:MAG: sialidase family protein [Kiritimatiellales bacterium]